MAYVKTQAPSLFISNTTTGTKPCIFAKLSWRGSCCSQIDPPSFPESNRFYYKPLSLCSPYRRPPQYRTDFSVLSTVLDAVYVVLFHYLAPPIFNPLKGKRETQKDIVSDLIFILLFLLATRPKQQQFNYSPLSRP